MTHSLLRLLPAAALVSILASGTLPVSAMASQGQTVPVTTDAPSPAKFYPLHTATEKAKSVGMTVTYSTQDASGAFSVKERYSATVSATGEARAEMLPSTAPASTATKPSPYPKPNLGVFNGKETVVYDPEKKLYLKYPADANGNPSSPFIPLRPITFAARGISEIALQAGPDDTIDGRKMKTQVAEMVNAKTKKPFSRTRYLIDAETNLLRIVETTILRDDEKPIVFRYEYTDWKINPTVTAGYFAWAPPAEAKEFTFPKPPPRPALLAVGAPAPDFTAIGANDKPVKLSDLKGKVVVLDFWATWCGPCQKAMPHLQKVYSQVKNKDVAVLALCVSDTREAYDKWVGVHSSEYTFPLAFDPAGRTSPGISGSLYKVSGIPTQYVIDRDGKVAATFVGFMGNDDTRLEEALKKLGVSLPETTASAK